MGRFVGTVASNVGYHLCNFDPAFANSHLKEWRGGQTDAESKFVVATLTLTATVLCLVEAVLVLNGSALASPRSGSSVLDLAQ